MPFDLPQKVMPVPAASLKFTTNEEIDENYARLTATFKSGETRSLPYRRKQLLQLARMLQDNHTAFEDALLADLNRPRMETTVSEVAHLITSVMYAVENLESWAAPDPCPTKEAWRSSWGATLYKEPKGVVLIISPWNYPLVLTVNPLIGAIAAGCPAVLKPSELVPTFCELIASLIPKYLDPNTYAVIKGGVPETTHALALRWDHIFYTGNSRVGRIVATAAGKNLTPLTLELGGKSAAVVADDCDDLDVVAKRILYGKLQNGGQLCVAPDYALVPKAKVDAFVESLKKAHEEFFPEGDHPLTGPRPISDIVHPTHHAHLVDLLHRTKGKVVFGGQIHKDKSIAPTILTDVPVDDVLMGEEIFGPILPILAVDDIDEAIRVINSKPIPLVIYLFTTQDELKHKFLRETRSGQLVVNDTIMQLCVHELPFGGQGESGYGMWFGKTTFDVFTHRRGCITVPFSDEPFFQGRYRPYTEDKYQAACAPGKVKIPDE
ncbi:aldehyde dehydrogenase [Polyporus arcularius HHB13444]|uniref:Aldehyde dehydrogenase n=1 Tax=Polyporus arcularius HHB13444 TaxID=1314778 RepID=A0A5C3P2C5_9APHY|nr:aldehyde dehydrogenase [Polyporus arcularius HHB13444]